MTMRLLILGGTGTTGKALIRHLRDESAPAEITVLSRTAAGLPGADRVLTGHYADVVPSADFRNQLAAFDAVVHLGDGLGVLQEKTHAADAALAERLIVATESVAKAARQAQVPRFVYISSIKALCDEHDDRLLVETSEPRPTTLYGRSKLRLEQAMEAAFAGSDTRVVTLRNPVMYGAAKKGSLQRLATLADWPVPLPFGGLDNRRSLLAVRNFAAALAAILKAGPGSPSGTFHVHDGPPLSTTEIMQTLRIALGRPARLFPAGPVASLLQRLPLLASTARRLYGSLELSDARFRRSFAWTPVVSTRAGLADMVEQLQSRTPAS
jgi:nucleoside-diphosphate-sugar epimerase